jgi:hypothetical protein
VSPLTDKIAEKEKSINSYHEELYLLNEEFKDQKSSGSQVIAKLNSDIEQKASLIVDLEIKIKELESKKEKRTNEIS